MPLVGKLQVCHILQQIITSRLKFYTTRFGIGPLNFEFFDKKSLSFWPRAKLLSYIGLEFFQKGTKNKPVLSSLTKYLLRLANIEGVRTLYQILGPNHH